MMRAIVVLLSLTLFAGSAVAEGMTPDQQSRAMLQGLAQVQAIIAGWPDLVARNSDLMAKVDALIAENKDLRSKLEAKTTENK